MITEEWGNVAVFFGDKEIKGFVHCHLAEEMDKVESLKREFYGELSLTKEEVDQLKQCVPDLKKMKKIRLPRKLKKRMKKALPILSEMRVSDYGKMILWNKFIQ